VQIGIAPVGSVDLIQAPAELVVAPKTERCSYQTNQFPSYKKLIKALFCGEAECEDLIKDSSGGAGSRNIPFGQKLVTGKCVHCGKQAKHVAYFGKGY